MMNLTFHEAPDRLSRMAACLQTLRTTEVAVGLPEGSGLDFILAIQEHGSPVMHIPARPVVKPALAAALGLSSDSTAAASLIRDAQATTENNPAPSRGQNVLYFSLTQSTGITPPPTEVQTSAHSAGQAALQLSNTLSYTLTLICYGPSAETNAHRIRSAFYLDGYGQPRALLRAAGIYPVPDPPQPILMTEESAGLRRRRADLSLRLTVADTLAAGTLPAITSSPAVTLHTQQ